MPSANVLRYFDCFIPSEHKKYISFGLVCNGVIVFVLCTNLGKHHALRLPKKEEKNIHPSIPCGIECRIGDMNNSEHTTNTKHIPNVIGWCIGVVANVYKIGRSISTKKRKYIYFEEFRTLWRHRNATLHEIVSLTERQRDQQLA